MAGCWSYEVKGLQNSFQTPDIFSPKPKHAAVVKRSKHVWYLPGKRNKSVCVLLWAQHQR